jgi:hypothetical protein
MINELQVLCQVLEIDKFHQLVDFDLAVQFFDFLLPDDLTDSLLFDVAREFVQTDKPLRRDRADVCRPGVASKNRFEQRECQQRLNSGFSEITTRYVRRFCHGRAS